jgi:hypothetical protein
MFTPRIGEIFVQHAVAVAVIAVTSRREQRRRRDRRLDALRSGNSIPLSSSPGWRRWLPKGGPTTEVRRRRGQRLDMTVTGHAVGLAFADHARIFRLRHALLFGRPMVARLRDNGEEQE